MLTFRHNLVGLDNCRDRSVDRMRHENYDRNPSHLSRLLLRDGIRDGIHHKTEDVTETVTDTEFCHRSYDRMQSRSPIPSRTCHHLCDGSCHGNKHKKKGHFVFVRQRELLVRILNHVIEHRNIYMLRIFCNKMDIKNVKIT
jgi:hypothetical protein